VSDGNPTSHALGKGTEFDDLCGARELVEDEKPGTDYQYSTKYNDSTSCGKLLVSRKGTDVHVIIQENTLVLDKM